MKRKFKWVIYALSVIGRGVFYSIKTIAAGDRTDFSIKIEKDILVCGNGPSLSDVNLKKINPNDMDVAVVNFFPVSNPSFFIIKPKYLFLLDGAFFTKKEEMEDVQLYDNVNRLKTILEKVDWDLVVVTHQRYNMKIMNKNIRFEKLSNYSLCGDVLNKFVDLLYRNNLVNVGGSNVIIGALFYFINKIRNHNIYLAGVDMSEFKHLVVDKENNVFVDAIHNYGANRKKVKVKPGGLYISLGWYQKMFEQFYYLSQYATRRNVAVYNLSTNSYLDSFAKISSDKQKQF